MFGFYYLCGVFSIAFYALLSPLSRKLALDGFPPFSFIAISTFLVFLFSFSAALLFEHNFSFSSLSRTTWGVLTGFACVNFIAFFLFVKTVAGVPAVHYQILGMLTPVFGGIFAWFLLKEAIDWRMFLGFLIMCIGLFVALSGKLFPSA